MEYIEFRNFSNKELKEQFIKELQGTDAGYVNHGVQHLKTLAKVITLKKNNIKLNLSRCKYQNVYTVMVSCHQDFILINLGKKYNFPRGFPILWIPGKMIKLFGFYPKFDNDDRQSPDTESEFDDVNNIQFFKKWSGYLGQVCIFKLEDKLCWSCCSKNSADYESEYVQGCKRLFEPFLTPINLSALLSQNYHLAAEMMSFNDQKHGARVLIETPVITSLGRGCLVHLDGSSPNVITQNMVDFIPHQPLVEFCREHSLPCDSAIIITNGNASAFMKELSAERDFMTNDKLNALIEKNSEKVTIIQGTVRHQDILGNVLEGLVVKATKSNGQRLTKKYKFPYYTVRTMALRELIKNSGPFNLINPRIDVEGFRNYCNRWCITPIGKEFWYRFLCTVALILKNREHPKLQSTEEVGLHIQITDFVKSSVLGNLLPPEIEMSIFDSFMERYSQEMANSIKSTVIISIGPIGSGKSSTSQKIADNSGGNIIHIDGDKLDLGSMKEVMNLKGERNDYTIWHVIRTIMLGKIPIISTGGGALYSFGKRQQFMLKQRIMAVLGVDVKIILLIPSAGIMRLEEYNSSNPKHNISNVYHKNLDDIMAAVSNRVERGEWSIPDNFYPLSKKTGKSLEEMKQDSRIVQRAAKNFSAKIVSASKKNLQFAANLSEIADEVIMYPRINQDNYAEIKALSLNYDLIFEKIVGPRDIPTEGRFQQHRILAKKPDDTYHHLTIQFSFDRQINLSIDRFEEINSRLREKEFYTGFMITLQGKLENGKLAKPCQFITIPDELDDIITDGGAHITVNAGDHAPAKMRDLTLALKFGLATLDVETKKGGIIKYTFNDESKGGSNSLIKQEQVRIVLKSNFGI